MRTTTEIAADIRAIARKQDISEAELDLCEELRKEYGEARRAASLPTLPRPVRLSGKNMAELCTVIHMLGKIPIHADDVDRAVELVMATGKFNGVSMHYLQLAVNAFFDSPRIRQYRTPWSPEVTETAAIDYYSMFEKRSV